jgi:hypothetical protein
LYVGLFASARVDVYGAAVSGEATRRRFVSGRSRLRLLFVGPRLAITPIVRVLPTQRVLGQRAFKLPGGAEDVDEIALRQLLDAGDGLGGFAVLNHLNPRWILHLEFRGFAPQNSVGEEIEIAGARPQLTGN